MIFLMIICTKGSLSSNKLLTCLVIDKSTQRHLGKGPPIKDVPPKGEEGGYKKCPKRRRSLVDLRRQGEGGYPKNLKFGETSFMDGP